MKYSNYEILRQERFTGCAPAYLFTTTRRLIKRKSDHFCSSYIDTASDCVFVIKVIIISIRPLNSGDRFMMDFTPN